MTAAWWLVLCLTVFIVCLYGTTGSQGNEQQQGHVCSEESKAFLGQGGRHCECPPDHRICVGPRCSVARNSTGHVVRQGFLISCKTCMCVSSLRDSTGKEVDVYVPVYRDLDAIHIAMVLADASPSLERKFIDCMHSLVERASKPVTLHLITDNPPGGNEHLPMSALAGVDLRVYEGEELLRKALEKGGELVRRLLPGLRYQPPGAGEGPGDSSGRSRSSMTLTDKYLALMPFYHLIFPELKKVIVLDADVSFHSDATLLWQIFHAFRTEELIGLVYEQSPVFRRVFADYRASNPRTAVGSPPAMSGGAERGFPGFNTGVVLLNLERMRTSDLYSETVYTDLVASLMRKYKLQGRLTPATLFTLMATEHRFLFRVLPCRWNRQLCEEMRTGTYARVFDTFHRCEEDPILIYHGSCNTPPPEHTDAADTAPRAEQFQSQFVAGELE